MNQILREAFSHSAWATRTLLATCRDLTADQLRCPAGGFGSIVATLDHLVLADAGYAAALTGMRPAWASSGPATEDLSQLEVRAGEVERLWERFLAGPLDADRLLVLDDGRYECPVSLVVAQALHHAAAHREQVRAGLAALGVRSLDLQPWAYADATGRARWRRPGE